MLKTLQINKVLFDKLGEDNYSLVSMSMLKNLDVFSRIVNPDIYEIERVDDKIVINFKEEIGKDLKNFLSKMGLNLDKDLKITLNKES